MYIASLLFLHICIMENFLNSCINAFYSRFDIRIAAGEDVSLDAWPGAIIRNNFQEKKRYSKHVECG